ncbi:MULTISPECIES: glycosyltransferase family 2 protein [unclassified Cryobacterium]|uniref:glycosyltransferase family 2 protein n=1 Tax=unclassified Cryobacterium TaxID=2649013 RepID=UPI00106C800F|nr:MULTISPECIES: glycosyltransferase family 2 protein [unclassified Cryobacterium]TFD09620.1 glycosyltransferase family 2 protein [Cryobacterium sp. TMT1-2-2]TFD10267.1 glycosyltransferase family 2 protein [Cryobacterium sp. TMT1-66-1]
MEETPLSGASTWAHPLVPQVVFKPESTPVVSVVVLAWRLSGPLRQALASVANSRNPPPFEVIVVLNGASPDVRQTVATDIVGAHLVDVPENTGFGDGCNRGSAIARGRFLLFLNDDAVADLDMIRALVDAADAPRAPGENHIGAVAAVLLNPDGTLQEAGSRMLGTAGTVQLGAGLSLSSSTAIPFLRRRSIDYGSGAAVLVRHEVFSAIGGYDKRYRPAYFEDADLSFRFKSLGFDVIVEPKARATHLSGASTDRDLRFRRFASDHAGLAFIERWKHVLAAAPTADSPIEDTCQIPRADFESLPDDEFSSENPLKIAVSIAHDYAGWLNAALDSAEAEISSLRSQLDQATDAARTVEDELRPMATRAGELGARLHELEHRGAYGLVKWRLGAALLHRSEKRSR